VLAQKGEAGIARSGAIAARRRVAREKISEEISESDTCGLCSGAAPATRSGMAALASLARLADLALPPRCPGCGEVTAADHRFCAPCWGSLRFLGPPWCAICQLPFAFDRGEGAQCAECMDRAAAA
jgi:hypothetical protein